MRLNLTALARLPLDALHDAIREQVIAQLLADKDERNRELGEQMRADSRRAGNGALKSQEN
jgi:hypothetical protein